MRAYKNSSSIKSQKDARVHCAVLNVRPDTDQVTPPDPPTPRRVRQRYEMQTGPDTRQQSLPRRGWPAPSGPNSVPTNQPPAPTPFHAPASRRTRAPYWGQPQLPAELVSVPPSSTTQATSAPPGTGRRVHVLAWLWTGSSEADRSSAP